VGIVRLTKDNPRSKTVSSNNFPTVKATLVARPSRRSKSKGVISCSINHLNFHAEGTRKEVIEKFTKFLDHELAPVRAVIRAAVINAGGTQ
jgi:hypothetical protein